MNVLVLVFGCFNRSFHITRHNHDIKIFDILKQQNIKYATKYVNNHVDKIDGKNVTPRRELWLKHLNKDDLVEYKQSDIMGHINDSWDINSLFNVKWYSAGIKKRAALNSYLETFSSNQIDPAIHDKVIAFCSDLWFGSAIDVDWLSCDAISVGNQNPAQGLTNGFYCGPAMHIKNMMDTFDHLDTLSAKCDFEGVIKNNCIRHDINYITRNFQFLKIRADGKPAYSTTKSKRIWNKIKHIMGDYQNYVA